MPLRHTLLGLLSEKPMHGYLLRKHAKAYSWIYPMTNASIYPALHGLEEDGFIAHDSEIRSGRARKIYRITAEGTEDLKKWLNEPIHQAPCFRDQMLLKIVMHSESGLRDARDGIEKALEELRNEIAFYQSNKNAMSSKTAGADLAHEYGFEMLRLRVRFFEQILSWTQSEEATRNGHNQQEDHWNVAAFS